MSRKLKAVLFDVDGTLIDSNDAHARAWQEAFSKNGFDIPFSLIRSKIGMGGDHLIPELINHSADSTIGKKIDEFRGKTFTESYLPTLKPFPFAQQLVERIAKSGLKVVAASSASKEDLNDLLGRIGVTHCFDAKTDSDQVKNSKPSADIIQKALSQVNVSASDAVMIGDTPYDIEASHRARVQVIAFTCGGWSPSQLTPAQQVLANPEELYRLLTRSPLDQTAVRLREILEGHQSQIFL